MSSTIVPRLGSKVTAIKHLKPIFAEMLTKYYCEPFLGSGTILRMVKQMAPDTYCLVGDIDGELSNFYKQAFMNTEEFIELVQNAPLHSGLFEQLRSGRYPQTDLNRAFAFYYYNKLSGPSSATRLGGLKVHKDGRDTLINGLNKSDLKQTLSSLTHQCYYFQEDYARLIARADELWCKNNYLLYLDPPYMGSESYYASEKFDHEHLREVVGDRENVILSYNDCEEIRDLYDGFELKSYTVRKSRQELVLWKSKNIDPFAT